MDRKILWRVGLIVVVLALAGATLAVKDINLGLDLKGGTHLVLRVNTDDAVKAELDDAGLRLVSEARDAGISLGGIEADVESLSFRVKVPANADADKLRGVAARVLPGFRVSPGADAWTVGLPTGAERDLRESAVRQALETIRNRIDQFGVAEPVIQRQLESNRIVIQLPGVDDPGRVKRLISNTAMLEFQEVVAGPAADRETLLRASGGVVPSDAEVASGDRYGYEREVIGTDYYLLKRAAILSGRELRNARRGQDQYGMAVVNFATIPAAATKFAEYTGSHVGTNMAIVLDGKVMSAPVIRSRIPGGEGVIEGNFSIQEAEDLSLVLRAGALPASITYLEERTVGPALGRDSVRQGTRAGVVGLLLVVGFMLVYYKLSGVNANVALALNVLLLMGAMAYFGATLTLPGIAGVILTIGMAVDGNVLIFERIREELRNGKTVRAAIEVGFERAFGTIVDSNLTTLIAALFLFQFGTGPIRGFAVTLSIGIASSVFTAVFVSRTIYMLVLRDKPRVETLSI